MSDVNAQRSTLNAQRKQRRSARTILLSPANDVLLIHLVVPRSGEEFAFWATPGGEVEEGEDDLAAVQRELREELELTVELLGPVHLSEAEFEHKGAMGEIRALLPRLSGAQVAGLPVDHRDLGSP